MNTADLALMVMDGWHLSSRLRKDAYRQMGEIAQRCADDLGEDCSDTDMARSLIAAWLKEQGLYLDGSQWSVPEPNTIYLGYPDV